MGLKYRTKHADRHLLQVGDRHIPRINSSVIARYHECIKPLVSANPLSFTVLYR